MATPSLLMARGPGVVVAIVASCPIAAGSTAFSANLAPALRFHLRQTPRARICACLVPGSGETLVDKNRTEGAKNQIKGTAKEVAGKLTGNTAKEIEGKAQKTAGKVQSSVGKARDDARKGH